MTPDEILSAAREIVELGRIATVLDGEYWLAKARPIAAELIRLHDVVEWTAASPTRPGWYWFKANETAEPCIIDVKQHANGDLYMTAGVRNFVCLLPKGLWIGPLAPAMPSTLAELEGLKAAIAAAGFSVMKSSNGYSIHDVSEKAKADEERTAQVISENVDLARELAEAKAELAKQKRCPWERSMDEICPVHGGPCGECPLQPIAGGIAAALANPEAKP